ncbi:MAG: TldD/PmbA family protein [Chloroflexi bacterium]|nr:TldD/PmbA family protein [Chloroflexota bacterium]
MTTPKTTTKQQSTVNAVSRALRDQYGFLREIVAEMERSVPYASALVSGADGVRLTLRDGEQQASRREPRHGIVLTASNGAFIEEEASSSTDPDDVRRVARELAGRAGTRAKARANGTALQIDPGDPLDADFATAIEQDPAAVPLADKLARYEALRQKARGLDARIVQAMLRYADGSELKIFVNRAKFVTEVLRRVDLFVQIIVSDGTQRRYDWRRIGGTGGLELLELSDADLEDLRDTTVALLTSRTVAPGVYDVVTDPGVTGVLAHEAFGHGVETDMFLKHRARGAEYVGKQVGSPLVTIMDDPTVPHGYGSYFVDDEGQPATPTCIIKDGILQRGLTDLNSAMRLGIPRSANGRRESFERKAYARMSNTFFVLGTHTPEQLLESLDNGLLLCQVSSGMEDPKGWGIQISTHYAREYRGGKPTGVIYSPISITGYVPDLLHDVSMVANDFHLHPGGCGKGWKEYISVGDGGPHLRTRVRIG